MDLDALLNDYLKSLANMTKEELEESMRKAEKDSKDSWMLDGEWCEGDG